MQPPIVMAAFGTTTEAVATYTRLDRRLRHHFPETEIFWASTSKTIAQRLNQDQAPAAMHAEEVLRQLAARGVPRVIMQSLHLFPGSEFHGLLRLAGRSRPQCAIGMPLLTSPQDYHQVGEILRPVITLRPDKAILVLGHGTAHPSWTAYYSLEKILRMTFGARVYVGVVEKYPDTALLVDEIAGSGFSEVCIIPLFLVAGMHYRRDIVGAGASSWRSRLEGVKIAVECIEYGLGMYPGLAGIIIRHITEAANTFA